MKTLSCLALMLFALTARAQTPAEPLPYTTAPTAEAVHEPATAKVIMKTSLGNLVLALETERAPITAKNFLRYVDQKRFDGIGFYRAFKMDEAGHYGLVQAGLHGDQKKLLKPIAHESTTLTGLSHVSGAISMARLAPGTATAEFFIVLGDLPALDAQPLADTPPKGDNLGYAVFGHVVEGMDVVRAILEQPHSTAGEGVMKGQMLKEPVKILTVRRAP